MKKLVKDASKLSREHVQGLMQQLMKEAVFNASVRTAVPPSPSHAAMDTS
jgi:hypothetical protein